MKLEDTIKHRLFTPSFSDYIRTVDDDFVIECKAEQNKAFPICVAPFMMMRSDLVYKTLKLDRYSFQTRSTPRSLYNILFSNWMHHQTIMKATVKDVVYYYAQGVLFNAEKEPLFWFGLKFDSEFNDHPYLFLSPKLLHDATVQGKPMEKFFMSTVVPFLIDNDVYTCSSSGRTVIEIDNDIDSTFFIPSSNIVSSTPVDKLNDRLNGILADNVDILSTFTDSYLTPEL